MKKLLLLAAFGVAGMMSANVDVNENSADLQGDNLQSSSVCAQVNGIVPMGGYCSIYVYRDNGAEVPPTLVGVWGGYASSQADCDAHGNAILSKLETGADPNTVSYY